MKVVLQENVANLGKVGDQVMVKPGYGRNYLLPKGLAVMATKANIEAFESRRAELEAKAATRIADAKVRADQLATASVKIAVKAGEEGKLFGSVGPRDIAQAVSAAGFPLQKSEVDLPDGPLRSLGEYAITVHLHSHVVASVKVILEAE